MKLAYFTIITTCLLAGCTSSLDSESVKSYKDHSITEFVKDRFTINSSVHHGLYSGLDVISNSGNNHDLYWYHATSKPMPDGSYVFIAFFGSPANLRMPKNDLSLFCSSKGGTLNPISIYKKDILSQYEVNPMQAYEISVRELSNVRVTTNSGLTSYSRPLTDGEISSVAIGEAMKTADNNRYSDIAYAKKDYYSAINSDSFGTFKCVDSITKHSIWQVSIVPIAYKKADNEHLITDALYIGIKV